MSKGIVQHVWREADLRPHRLPRYMVSTDPDFETKAAENIGRCLDPPRHAAAFSGEVLGKPTARHTSQDLVDLLGEWSQPANPTRMSARSSDNPSIHKTRIVAAFRDEHPNVALPLTLTYSSWLNQVALWSSKVQRDVLSRGIFASRADLAGQLRRHLQAYARHAKPFRWKYADPTRRIRHGQPTSSTVQ